MPRFITPTPTDMWVELGRMYRLENLIANTSSTALYTVLGFAIGSALGAALGYLLAGLRISSTLAVIGVTVGELVGGNTGLGFLIAFGGGQANAAMVFNAIILLTIIGIILYSVLAWMEKKLLHYIPKAHQ